jgi:hypothetical protein
LSTKFKLKSKGKYLYLVLCKSLIDERKFRVKTRANNPSSAIKKVRRTYGKKYECYAYEIKDRLTKERLTKLC